MFKDRIFNISFLISLFWHFFWMSVVTIITVPTGLSLAEYTKIYFLGPVLERTAFELMLEESPIQIATVYRRPIMPHYAFEVEMKSPKEAPFDTALKFDKSFLFKFSPRDIIREDKMTVPHFFRGVSSVSPEYIESKSPLREREVVSKPDEMPKVPVWIVQDKESFKIELEFTVSPQGTVERIAPIVSSGYPQIDMIGMDYLKKWRFTPLGPSEKQKHQTGRIKIELKVK